MENTSFVKSSVSLFSTRYLSGPSIKVDDKHIIMQTRRSSSFDQLFRSLGVNLNKLCLTQREITRFCEENLDILSKKLSNEAFFLCRKKGKFVVIHATFSERYVCDNWRKKLNKYEYELSYNHGWCDGRLLVIPKKALPLDYDWPCDGPEIRFRL